MHRTARVSWPLAAVNKRIARPRRCHQWQAPGDRVRPTASGFVPKEHWRMGKLWQKRHNAVVVVAVGNRTGGDVRA